MKAQELDNIVACDASCGRGRVGVLSIYWGVTVGTFFFRLRKRWAAAEMGLM